jgi:hypothetical protein
MSNSYDYYELKNLMSLKNFNKNNKREPYVFTISATNSIGSSSASTPTSDILPNTVPGSPTITKLNNVAINGGKQCNVYFVPSTDNGGSTVTNYIVSTNDNITASGTTSPINVTGLTNGKLYTFSIYAVNSVGKSPLYTYPTSFTPYTSPKNVTNLSSSFLNNKINIKFTPPTDNGGKPITKYIIEYGITSISITNTINIDISGNISSTVDSNTFILSETSKDASGNISFNLSPKTTWSYVPYKINIRTCNSDEAYGCCDTRATTEVTPVKLADNVTNLSATSNEKNKSTIIFTPPSGSFTNNFTIVSNPATTTQVVNVTNTAGNISGVSSPAGATFNSSDNKITVPFTGLTNGTSYTFTVTTTNSSNLTSSGVTTTPITPGSFPDSPGNLTATPADNGIKISFKVPPNNGKPITEYTLKPYYTTTDSSGNRVIKCVKPISINKDNYNSIITSAESTDVSFTSNVLNDRTKTFSGTVNATDLTPVTCESYSYVPLKKNKKSNCCWFVFLLFIIICFFIFYYRNKKF